MSHMIQYHDESSWSGQAFNTSSSAHSSATVSSYKNYQSDTEADDVDDVETAYTMAPSCGADEEYMHGYHDANAGYEAGLNHPPFFEGDSEVNHMMIRPITHFPLENPKSWSVMALPGKNTGYFYTTIANLPHHTDGHTIRTYFKDHGLKVSFGEVSGTGSGWVCVEDFNSHVRVQKIIRHHKLSGRHLTADGSNSIKHTVIVTFKEKTARKIQDANMQSSFISDILSPLGLYDPTYNECDLDVNEDRNSQPREQQQPSPQCDLMPIALDEELHKDFINNVSEIIEVPLPRFPPIYQDSTAETFRFFTEYYWAQHPTRPGNKFLPRPNANTPSPKVVYPTHVMRLKPGYKLPHLCSVVVETATKLEVLDNLYGIRINFDEGGTTTAEAEVWWVGKDAAKKASKKLNRASIAKMHVLTKMGSGFRPPAI